MRRGIALATLCLLALAAAAATVVSAQEPLRTVTITAGPRSVGVEGADALPAGPTRIVFATTGRGEVEGVLVALRPGQTIEDLRRALPRAEDGPGPLKPVVTFEANGASVRGTPYATTIDLRPNTTYVAANIGERPRDTRFSVIAVGAAVTTAVRPQPAATVGLYDYAFGMPSALPRSGVVRFENRGERLHIAIAFPVRPGANRANAVKAFIRNQERRAGRLTVGRRAFSALGVAGPGTVNDVELDFRRPGNWLFVCFIEDGEPGNPGHYELGMVKAFRVR
jgi:hypothetical protein